MVFTREIFNFFRKEVEPKSKEVEGKSKKDKAKEAKQNNAPLSQEKELYFADHEIPEVTKDEPSEYFIDDLDGVLKEEVEKWQLALVDKRYGTNFSDSEKKLTWEDVVEALLDEDKLREEYESDEEVRKIVDQYYESIAKELEGKEEEVKKKPVLARILGNKTIERLAMLIALLHLSGCGLHFTRQRVDVPKLQNDEIAGYVTRDYGYRISEEESRERKLVNLWKRYSELTVSDEKNILQEIKDTYELIETKKKQLEDKNKTQVEKDEVARGGRENEEDIKQEIIKAEAKINELEESLEKYGKPRRNVSGKEQAERRLLELEIEKNTLKKSIKSTLGKFAGSYKREKVLAFLDDLKDKYSSQKDENGRLTTNASAVILAINGLEGILLEEQKKEQEQREQEQREQEQREQEQREQEQKEIKVVLNCTVYYKGKEKEKKGPDVLRVGIRKKGDQKTRYYTVLNSLNPKSLTEERKAIKVQTNVDYYIYLYDANGNPIFVNLVTRFNSNHKELEIRSNEAPLPASK